MCWMNFLDWENSWSQIIPGLSKEALHFKDGRKASELVKVCFWRTCCLSLPSVVKFRMHWKMGKFRETIAIAGPDRIATFLVYVSTSMRNKNCEMVRVSLSGPKVPRTIKIPTHMIQITNTYQKRVFWVNINQFHENRLQWKLPYLCRTCRK